MDATAKTNAEVADNNPPTLVSISPEDGPLTKETSFDVIAILSDGYGLGVDLENSTIAVELDGGAVPGEKKTEGEIWKVGKTVSYCVFRQ